VRVFNSGFSLQQQVYTNQISPSEPLTFTRAIRSLGRLFIGTATKGLFAGQADNPMAFDNITPNGPLRNNVFSINTETPDVWLTFGGYPDDYNPFLWTIGLSKYNPEAGWTSIPYEEVHAPGKMASDLIGITFHPFITIVFYVSSYHSGLLEFEHEQLLMQFAK